MGSRIEKPFDHLDKFGIFNPSTLLPPSLAHQW
jgi:hypothetical protein